MKLSEKIILIILIITCVIVLIAIIVLIASIGSKSKLVDNNKQELTVQNEQINKIEQVEEKDSTTKSETSKDTQTTKPTDNTQTIYTSYVLVKGTDFYNTIPKDVTVIEFLNTAAPETATIDVSEAEDGSIMAWLDGTTYKIAPKESGHTIYANPDCSHMFSPQEGMEYDRISMINFENFDTSLTKNMYYMFAVSGNIEVKTWTVKGLENWNVSNVTNMEGMFASSATFATEWSVGNIQKWDTSNVTNMKSMFSGAGLKADYWLDISNWNVSDVVNYEEFKIGVKDKIVEPKWK